MIENNPGTVWSGFEMLLENVEAEIDFYTRIGSRAFESRDFRKVDEARTQAERITAFHDKVAALRKEWDAISGSEAEQDEETKAERRNLGRLRKGLRTPRPPTTCRFSRRWTNWVAAPRCRPSSTRSIRP